MFRDIGHVPERHTVFLVADNGSAWSLDNSTSIRNIGLTNIISISAGRLHFVALDKNSEVWTWGSNNKGGLGNGAYLDKDISSEIEIFGIKQIDAGIIFTIARVRMVQCGA